MALTLVSGLSGCDEPVSTVDRASGQMASLAASGPQTPTLPYREAAYREVIQTVRSETSSDNKGVQAAANTLTARAELALGELAIGRASEAAHVIDASLVEADARFTSWRRLALEARRLALFDPRDEIDGYLEEIPRKEGELAAAEQGVAEVMAEVRDLREQAEALFQESRLLRARKSDLGAWGMRSEPVRRAELAAREYEIGRVVAGVERQAERLLAEAAHTERSLPSLGLDVARLEGQLELLRSAVDDLRQAVDRSQTEAGRLQVQADELAGELMALLAEAEATRQNEFDPQLEEAMDALRRASSAAGRARGGDRAAGASLAASIDTAGANALSLRVDEDARYAALINRFASSDPGLPERDALIARLDAARSAADESARERDEAVRRAIESIEALSGLDDRAAARQVTSVENLYALLGEDVPQDGAGFGQSAAGFDSAAPPEPVAAGPATPEELVERLSEDPNDESLILVPDSGPIREFYEGSRRMSLSAQALFAAVEANLGESPDAGARAMLGATANSPLASFDDAAVTVEYDDDATARILSPGMPGGAPAAIVVLTDAGWVVDFEQTLDAAAETSGLSVDMLTQGAAMLPAMVDAIDGLTARVSSGELTSLDEVMAELGSTVQRVMMEQAGGG
ncbi:MAG: hypothetical protein AAF108_00255 [Planctomycetota bacterium]